MDRDLFKIIHSELIQQVQCSENNLRIVYAAMCSGDYEKNYKSVENTSFGGIVKKLDALDHSEGFPELTVEDYKTIEDIRNIRNYWCHKCYLDFSYIADDEGRERKFQEIATRLSKDENRTHALLLRTEKMKKYIYRKYRMN